MSSTLYSTHTKKNLLWKLSAKQYQNQLAFHFTSTAAAQRRQSYRFSVSSLLLPFAFNPPAL